MFRVILGICGSYFISFYAQASQRLSGDYFHFDRLFSEPEIFAIAPLIFGAMAGFCWHMIANEKAGLGSANAKREGVSFFVAVAKGLILFTGLPATAFFIFGGNVAAFTFFALIVLYGCYSPISEWVVGKDKNDE